MNNQQFADFACMGLALQAAIEEKIQKCKRRQSTMPTTKRYRIVVSWTHRKWGPQTAKRVSEGSSIRRALNNALLSFFSDSNSRRERLDAHAHLRVEIWRLKRE